jgi:hypothetical protein
VIFLSCKGNAGVLDANSWHGPQITSFVGTSASPKLLTNVADLQCATQPVWARNTEGHPTKVIPPSQTQRKLKPLPTVWRIGLSLTVPSVSAVIEIVDVVLRSHFMTAASEPTLTNPEVQ